MRVAVVFLSVLSLAEAFVAPAQSSFASSRISVSNLQSKTQPTTLSAAGNENHNDDDNNNMDMKKEDEFSLNLPSVATTTAAFWALSSTMAGAAGPDWGIFEGRTLSLLHPATMFGMLGLSISTALLGFNWRRQRTIGDEIKEVKKQLPDLKGAKTVQEALTAARAEETVDTAYVNKLEAALPISQEVADLETERKELSQKNPRDKHFSQGALLACIGTLFAIEGPLNTYARAGKLFPGPHLYAGAGLVSLWAIAYACVPSMQKGNDTARSIHIGANVAGIALFAWQVQSGIPILFKVLEFTKWP